ncbi:MAG: hypothetical protein HYZ34_15115 [Ignavibacteriae bacterium]|nr:hypothetical protein [Ignavibacteriota bacterium]
MSNKSPRDTIGGIMNFEVNFHFAIPARRPPWRTLAGGRHSVFIIHY